MMFGSTLFITATLALGAFGLISFKDKCPSNPGSSCIWHAALAVNDTTITFPGNYLVNITVSTTATITRSDPVSVFTRITKKHGLFGQDFSIPCTATTPGTCTYDNICDILVNYVDGDLATWIKSTLKTDLGINPDCPLSPASFSEYNRVIKVPALSTLDYQLCQLLAPFINGRWEFEFKMTKSNHTLAWLVAEVDLSDLSGSTCSTSSSSSLGVLGRK